MHSALSIVQTQQLLDWIELNTPLDFLIYPERNMTHFVRIMLVMFFFAHSNHQNPDLIEEYYFPSSSGFKLASFWRGLKDLLEMTLYIIDT